MALKLPSSVLVFQRATLAARARTGDRAIGTRVSEEGRVQVVRTIYPNGRGFAKVEPMSDFLPQADALWLLNSLGTDA